MVQLLVLFLNPLVLILLIAAAASALVGGVDASIIVVVVTVGVAINFVQTYRSSRAAERLREKVAPTATVLHDGKWRQIPRRMVVPGDLIQLSAGDMVSADAHLIESRNLYVHQAVFFHPAAELGPAAAHRGLAVADLDGDGRLDAVIAVLGEKPELWRNTTSGAGHWLMVRLRGRAVGARVRAGGQWQEVNAGSGYASSAWVNVHFGLGVADETDVEVFWPSGARQSVGIVKAGRVVAANEPLARK